MKRIYVLIRLFIHYLPFLLWLRLFKSKIDWLMNEEWIFIRSRKFLTLFDCLSSSPLAALQCTCSWFWREAHSCDETKPTEKTNENRPIMIDYVKAKSVMNTLITVYSHIVTLPLSYSSINPSCHWYDKPAQSTRYSSTPANYTYSCSEEY